MDFGLIWGHVIVAIEKNDGYGLGPKISWRYCHVCYFARKVKGIRISNKVEFIWHFATTAFVCFDQDGSQLKTAIC